MLRRSKFGQRKNLANCGKRHLRRVRNHYVRSRSRKYRNGIKKYDFGQVFTPAYYKGVTPGNIVAGFRKTGLWPVNKLAPDLNRKANTLTQYSSEPTPSTSELPSSTRTINEVISSFLTPSPQKQTPKTSKRITVSRCLTNDEFQKEKDRLERPKQKKSTKTRVCQRNLVGQRNNVRQRRQLRRKNQNQVLEKNNFHEALLQEEEECEQLALALEPEPEEKKRKIRSETVQKVQPKPKRVVTGPVKSALLRSRIENLENEAEGSLQPSNDPIKRKAVKRIEPKDAKPVKQNSVEPVVSKVVEPIKKQKNVVAVESKVVEPTTPEFANTFKEDDFVIVNLPYTIGEKECFRKYVAKVVRCSSTKAQVFYMRRYQNRDNEFVFVAPDDIMPQKPEGVLKKYIIQMLPPPSNVSRGRYTFDMPFNV